VVYTVAEVDDLQAFATGSAFAERLADGNLPEVAFEMARPTNNTQYQILGGSRVSVSHERNDDLALLLHAVLGNERTGDEGLLRNMRDLDARVARIESQISRLVPPEEAHVLSHIEKIIFGVYCGMMAVAMGATLWLAI
jgi:hypothetical protein